MFLYEYLEKTERVAKILSSLSENPNIISVHIGLNSVSVHIRGGCGLNADYSIPSGLKCGGNTICKKIVDDAEIIWFEDRDDTQQKSV